MNANIDQKQEARIREESKDSADSKEYEVPAIMSDDLVLFPGVEVLTVVSDAKNVAALHEAQNQQKILAYIPSSSHDTLGAIGTLSLVKGSSSANNDSSLNAELKGMWRIRVKKFIHSSSCLKVQFETVDESSIATPAEANSLMKQVQDKIDEFITLIPGIPSEIVSLLKHAKTPGVLADICANSPDFTHEDRVKLLGVLDEVDRLRIVSKLLEKQLVSLRKAVQVEPISKCEKCIELADRAFDSDPTKRSEIAVSFLNHVVQDHTGELLALLAEKYGPIFLNRRSLR